MDVGDRRNPREPFLQGPHRLAEGNSLAAAVYEATSGFPKREWYGIAAQLRRAAVSIASNIAEGQGRLTRRDFLHFPAISRESLLELQTQLAIALELGYLNRTAYAMLERQSAEILRMLNGLIESIKPQSDLVRQDSETRNLKLET